MRVDFYILGGDGARDRALFASRLAEKAYQQGHRLYLRVDSAAAAQQLDELLWTFRQGSFVPHARSEAAEDEPVIIGEADPKPDPQLVLVNLAPSLPARWQDYARIAEVVDQDPENLRAARARYRDYREAGYEPHYHRMDKGQ